MSNGPEVKMIERFKDKAYIGNFVLYKGTDKGCAFIIEIPVEGNRVFTGKMVESWEGVSREEGWILINEWIKRIE